MHAETVQRHVVNMTTAEVVELYDEISKLTYLDRHLAALQQELGNIVNNPLP